MLNLVVWDVQHGHATYLKTPTKNIAFDLGTGTYASNKEFSPLKHLKEKCGVSQLDALIITHPHRDHLDDIFNFSALSPRAFWRPGHLTEDEIRKGNREDDNKIIDEYLAIHKRYTRAIPATENPLLPTNNGGVHIDIFLPNDSATTNINNHSLVTVVSYASSKILIPGDNEPTSWNELLAKPEFVKAIAGTDILLAPHHGRESGFSPELFKHISPQLVIVSDGRFCDTSATDRYSKNANGWKVHKRSGGTVDRKCLTTRNDGVISVKLGNNEQQQAFIEVTID